jgi:hypothetical protein
MARSPGGTVRASVLAPLKTRRALWYGPKRRRRHWFTQGFDTLDLKEAKALLDELHADNEFRNAL